MEQSLINLLTAPVAKECPGLTWNGIGVLVRVLGDQSVFDMTTTHAVCTQEHQGFSLERWIAHCKERETVDGLSIGDECNRHPQDAGGALTWNLHDFLIGDQIVLIKDGVVLGQVSVTALFLLPPKDRAVHCKGRKRD